MPVAILLGFPKPRADRIKSELSKQSDGIGSGWAVNFNPPSGSGGVLRLADLDAALKHAQSIDASVHVLALTSQGGDAKKMIASRFVPWFRFRWLPSAWLNQATTKECDVVEGLKKIAAEENEWLRVVQPSAVDDALLLPKVSFSTKCSEHWDFALKFGDVGQIAGYEKLLKEFRSEHYKRHEIRASARDYFWTDRDGRTFVHTGQRHAEAPAERRWKYSFRIPDGFHYDVKHEAGREFQIKGAMGDRSVAKHSYINVDPHGFFRD